MTEKKAVPQKQEKVRIPRTEVQLTATVPSHLLGQRPCPGIGQQGILRDSDAVPGGRLVDCPEPTCGISLIP